MTKSTITTKTEFGTNILSVFQTKPRRLLGQLVPPQPCYGPNWPEIPGFLCAVRGIVKGKFDTEREALAYFESIAGA